MRLCNQSFEWVRPFTTDDFKLAERIGRVCWKSEDRIGPETWRPFVRKLCTLGHWSVLEHVTATARIVTNRAIANQIVRHRIGAYTQESTRYCRYSDRIRVIRPVWWDERPEHHAKWLAALAQASLAYTQALRDGQPPDEARDLLPLATRTELYVTYNARMWVHVLNARTHKKAHRQVIELLGPVKQQLARDFPEVFGDNQ